MATPRSFLAKFLSALLLSALAPISYAQSQSDLELAAAAADAVLRGCDILDTSSCLYPFPSDHYTVAVGDGETARTQKHLHRTPGQFQPAGHAAQCRRQAYRSDRVEPQ